MTDELPYERFSHPRTDELNMTRRPERLFKIWLWHASGKIGDEELRQLFIDWWTDSEGWSSAPGSGLERKAGRPEGAAPPVTGREARRAG